MKLKKFLSTSSFILMSTPALAGLGDPYDTVVMCRACPAGYSGNGGGTECTQCSKGTYQDEMGKNSCKSVDPGYCSTGSVNTSQTKCTSDIVLSCDPQTCAATSCKAGYGLYNGECKPCGAGTYKSSNGSEACSNVTGTNCSTGSANTGYSSCGTGVSACENNTCKVTSCSGGYGYSSSGKGSCSACTGSTYSAGGKNSCYTCYDSSEDCDYGYSCKEEYSCKVDCNCKYVYDKSQPQNTSCLEACRSREYTSEQEARCNDTCYPTKQECEKCDSTCTRNTTCYKPGTKTKYYSVNSSHSSCNATGGYGSCTAK